jgi:phosphoribosylformylglycinamidine (FGAM) synthase-like amidotransferase family enzyme
LQLLLIVPLSGRCDLGICNGIGTASERILVVLALAILTPPAQARQTERARTQFECATTKVIMTNKAGQTNSVQVEEHMTFWIDDAAKTFIFSDGRRLRVTRFDKSWISANSDDIEYEFNRADGTLTYAGSTTKDSVTTTIVGSGLCEDASTEKT